MELWKTLWIHHYKSPDLVILVSTMTTMMIQMIALPLAHAPGVTIGHF